MLKTEMRNEKTTHIDKASTIDMLRMINDENRCAVEAVENEIENIAKAVDIISEKIGKGGRLVYVGCGTSGRLGVLDAAEIPTTFGVANDTVIGIIAGGDKCLRLSLENEDDKGERGRFDISDIEPTPNDVIVGISVAGEARYVNEAVRYAKSVGCVTIGLTSNEDSTLANISDITICTDTGAEAIAGSTRMKAGTADKIVLNMLSTGAMIKQGYVYENLMINLKPKNVKLKARAIRIVSEIAGVDEIEAAKLLTANDWEIKKAVESSGKEL